MRQLIIPACLCLVTWSSATDTIDSRHSPEQVAVPLVASLNDATSDRKETGDRPAVNTGAMPVTAGNQTDPAQAPVGIEGTKVAALSPHSDRWADFEPLQLVSPPPPPPKAAMPVIRRTRDEICDTLARAANDNNLPAHFFIRLLYQESRFNADVVSHAGALGIAQFMAETADDVRLDNPFDPVQAISASARHLRTLVRQFGNLGLAAAAYNAGPGRVQDWLIRKSKLPDETVNYVKVVTGRPAETWKLLNAGAPEMALPIHAPCWETANQYAWYVPPEIPLPQLSPRREAERLAAARERERQIERRMATLVAMKAVIKNLPVRKQRKGGVQLAARGREQGQRSDKKK